MGLASLHAGKRSHRGAGKGLHINLPTLIKDLLTVTPQRSRLCLKLLQYSNRKRSALSAFSLANNG